MKERGILSYNQGDKKGGKGQNRRKECEMNRIEGKGKGKRSGAGEKLGGTKNTRTWGDLNCL